jgi:hypothetical protein
MSVATLLVFISSRVIEAMSINNSLQLVKMIITAIPKATSPIVENNGSRARNTEPNISSRDMSSRIKSLLDIAVK